MKAILIHIHGHVQGVFFRASAVETATRLGLVGYAKNLPDGSVEILAQGQEIALDDLVKWAHNGPAGARVDQVEIEPAATNPTLKNFTMS